MSARSMLRRALTVVLGVALLAGGDGAAAAAEPALYVVFAEREGGYEPVFSRRVSLREPLRSLDEDAFAAAAAAAAATRGDDAEVVTFAVRGAGGRLIHRGAVTLATRLHVEVAGGDGSLRRFEASLPERTFAVRLPLPAPGGTLELGGAAAARSFAMASLASAKSELDITAFSTATVVAPPNDNPANRVDLLILGDGYRAADAEAFTADAERVQAQLLSIEPYARYRGLLAFTSIFVASAQAGADHPPFEVGCGSGAPNCCGDSGASSDPLAAGAGTFVETAFDSTFCFANIHRLLVPNQTKVLAAAAAAPDWDELVLLVNDETYGGAGATRLAVTSLDPSAIEILRHEYGHSFTALGDEYETQGVRSACSDDDVAPTAPPCPANLTSEKARALVKWEPWIDPDTPVPTPLRAGHEGAVGLFEGGGYAEHGIFRPRESSCLMRSLGEPFCEVCRQEYVLRLYSGSWAAPPEPLSPIEPGSEFPPPGEVAWAPDLQLGFTPALELDSLVTEWWLDGVLQPTSGPVFTLAGDGAATQTLELRVADRTEFVHPGAAGDALRWSRSWTVRQAAPRVPPQKPRDLRATALSRTSIRLDWVDASANEESFRVEVKRGRRFVEIATVEADRRQLVVEGLSRRTAYVFRVRAANALGFSAYSNKARAKTRR